MDRPGRPADLIDYLLVLRDEPCARTVPESLLKSISWMERVAEFKVELGRLAWAAKDKIVEVLHEGAPLIRRAPRYPVMVLVIFERVVMDDSEPTGLRVYAWAKLVKVWASLRWSNRRIKEMPLCVSEAAFFENPDWLKIGFELLQWLATFSRDYLLPKLKPDFAVFEKKMWRNMPMWWPSRPLSFRGPGCLRYPCFLPDYVSWASVGPRRIGGEVEARQVRYLC